MSKKHKHDYKHKHKHQIYQEHTEFNIVPEEQRLLVIILLLKALSEKIKENNNLIEIPLVNVDSNKKHEKTDTEEVEIEEVEEVVEVENEVEVGDLKDYIKIYNEETIQNMEIVNEVENIEKNKKENSISKEEIVEEDKESDKESDKEDDKDKSKINEIEDVSYKITSRSKVTSCKTTMLQDNVSKSLEYYSFFQSGVTKIPVILSQIHMKVFVESVIKFPEPVFQIKDLDRSIFLNKCELILGTDKLFVKGFIQENIEYATSMTIKKNTINGEVKKSIFNIPFKCSTKVVFNNMPKIPKSSYSLELEIINPNINKSCLDIKEKSYEHFEFLNEKVLCKIDNTEIMEIDNKEEMKSLKNTLEKAQTFQKIRKKMILNLGISLLQEQKIFLRNKEDNEC